MRFSKIFLSLVVRLIRRRGEFPGPRRVAGLPGSSPAAQRPSRQATFEDAVTSSPWWRPETLPWGKEPLTSNLPKATQARAAEIRPQSGEA